MSLKIFSFSDLKKQAAEEKAQIENAPKVIVGPSIGRCHFCGRLAQVLKPVETINGRTRYKGECCYRGENHVHRPAH